MCPEPATVNLAWSIESIRLGEKSRKAVNLERKRFIILVPFFPPKFLELSVTEAQSSLPVPVACVC